MIWNVKKMKKTLRDLHFDTEKNPLGKLSMIQIQKGFKVLSKLQNEILKEGNNSRAIKNLSNQFYTNIP